MAQRFGFFFPVLGLQFFGVNRSSRGGLQNCLANIAHISTNMMNCYPSLTMVRLKTSFQANSSYLHNRWAQFDLFMFVSHWTSWMLHFYQLLLINFSVISFPYEVIFFANTCQSPQPYNVFPTGLVRRRTICASVHHHSANPTRHQVQTSEGANRAVVKVCFIAKRFGKLLHIPTVLHRRPFQEV